MITTTDAMPFAGTIGSGFFIGLLAGYAIKKIIKIAAIIIGLFIAALAYLEYQRIIQVDWNMLQTVSQNVITWLTIAVIHMGADHVGISTNPGISNVIPLASSASAGFMLGMARG